MVMAGAAKLNLDGIIETFSTWDEPQKIRKALFLIYTKLTNYILTDENVSGACNNLSEAMYLLQTIIENCDEMEDMENRHFDITEI